jgi:hypothetical protein
MPQFVSQFFALVVDWVWGMPLIIVLMGGAQLYLCIRECYRFAVSFMPSGW